jgi:TusA-related sulfurtransferase
MPITANETTPIPLNGQFLKSGDTLEIKADTDLAVHATLSFTQGQSEEDDVV